MIASLFGAIEVLGENEIIIDVNGVGYRVFVATSENFNTPKMKLFIHTQVREDALELYGFKTLDDLRLFEKLIGVSGIGPKTALGIFNRGGKNEILEAIEKENVNFFIGIPRLGTKNAQKIIIDLKGKLDNFENLSFQNSNLRKTLLDLGFKDSEIREAMKNINNKEDFETQIKIALKFLAKK